jgi:DNA-binding transcriptional MerR regulator
MMASPRKKGTLKGKSEALLSKGDHMHMHSAIEVVVRAVIAEKNLQTKKGSEIAINKATAEMKTQISSLEARMAALDVVVQGTRSHLDESVQRIQQDIFRLNGLNEENPKKYIALLNKVGKKQRDDLEAVKQDTTKRLTLVEEEMQKIGKELAKYNDAM